MGVRKTAQSAIVATSRRSMNQIEYSEPRRLARKPTRRTRPSSERGTMAIGRRLFTEHASLKHTVGMMPYLGRRPMRSVMLLVMMAASVLADRPRLHADEGMWTFDNPPLALLKERYGFTPTSEWLNHLRMSTVRINDGGTGSFVSATGLVLTNHHVALGQLEKMST